MITKILDSHGVNFGGERLEYGTAQTSVFEEINLGPRFTQEFIKRTAGTYAEFQFAKLFNGKTEFEEMGKVMGSSDVFDNSGKGWEIKSRNFSGLCTAICFCGSADNTYSRKGISAEDSVKKKFEDCAGIVVVDHQLLSKNGTCRFWKIHSQQIMKIFEDGLWLSVRNRNGIRRKITQTARAKTVQTFATTMTEIFNKEFAIELAA